MHLKHLIFSIKLVFLCSAVNTVIIAQTFSRKLVSEDLQYLKEALEKKHPNYTLYSSKAECDNFFDTLSLPAKLTVNSAYTQISAFSELLQDGHTLFYPPKTYLSAIEGTATFFPLLIEWKNSKALVVDVIDEQYSSLIGHEVLSIDGNSIEKIKAILLRSLMREGDNLQYGLWVFEEYFFEYYAYHFGNPNQFEIQTTAGDTSHLIGGATRSQIINKARLTQSYKKAISSTFFPSKSTAVLTIKDWHTDILKQYYNQSFAKIVKPFFDKLIDTKMENLIIDLRDNQGGNFKHSKLLLSYLVDKPFIMIESSAKVQKGRVKRLNKQVKGNPQPDSKRFNGNIFVLINGGSFSNSTIFAAALKKYRESTFIGTETGGSAFTLSAGQRYITLPHTQIRVFMSTISYTIQELGTSSITTGVIPDHYLNDFEIPTTKQGVITETTVSQILNLYR